MLIYSDLGSINSKASPQQNKDWLEQALKKMDKIVSADRISQEITKYFEDIRKAFDACQVCITYHIGSTRSLRLCTLQRRILFCIERNTSDISKVSTGSLFEYWEI